MDEFKVEIPPQKTRRATEFVNKERALAWADDLPLTDPNALSTMLVGALKEINQAKLDIVKRYEVLEVMRPITRTANENLEKSYLRTMLPMSARTHAAFAAGRCILEEMAKAYLILVDDVIQSAHPVAMERLLPYALYHAISYLGRMLVTHYVVYSPIPKGVWAELHRLYILAREHKKQSLVLKISRKRGDTRERSIDQAYKRVLLVAQAEPYHLMQGEVNAIYNLMEQWSSECKLFPFQAGELPDNGLVVDMGADVGAYYLLKDGVRPAPENGWVFMCDGVRSIMNKKIRSFLAPVTTADKVKYSLSERLERDMYFRLSDGWANRRERLHERTEEQDHRGLVVGLSAYHYVMSDGADFEPEKVEVILKKKDSEEGNIAGLELVSEDDDSWKVEKEIASVESGIKRMRLSDFEDEKNVWEDIHANQARHQAVMQDRQAEVASTAYQERTCVQLDKSLGGLKLYAESSSGILLKSGELLGLNYCEATKKIWRLASVRWVMSDGEGGINFGIRFIADNATPMASRGIKGAGEGGEYIRVLVATEMVQNKRELSLITPAAVYDLDSEVMLNNGKELRQVRLSHMIETTNTFSRFRFEVV